MGIVHNYLLADDENVALGSSQNPLVNYENKVKVADEKFLLRNCEKWSPEFIQEINSYKPQPIKVIKITGDDTSTGCYGEKVICEIYDWEVNEDGIIGNVKLISTP